VEGVSVVYHVRSDYDMKQLLRVLGGVSYGQGFPVGIDTETVGCDPSKESPVGTARVWCTTLAWRGLDDIRTAFVPRQYTYHLAGWLEGAGAKKVGTNIYGYEAHVFRNMGIELRGIYADTVDMSRLLDPRDRLDEHGGHGLKPWGKRLGYDVLEYKEVFKRRKPGAIGYYKRDGTVTKGGVTIHRVAGAGHQRFLSQWETMPIDVAWRDYPQRRDAIVQYAVQDALMSLETFYVLREKLRKLEWQ
jgi:hypothetical protein